VRRRETNRALGQALRRVNPTQGQQRAAEPMISPAKMADDTSRGMTLEKGLTFLHPIESLVDLTELGEAPRQRGDGVRQEKIDALFPHRRGPVLDRRESAGRRYWPPA
jgi:hypothetical protein